MIDIPTSSGPVVQAAPAPVVEVSPAVATQQAVAVVATDAPAVPVTISPADAEIPVAPVSRELQEYVRKIETENAQAQQQALLAARNEFVSRRTGEYEQEGLSFEIATKLATRDGDQRLREIQSHESRTNQISAAIDIAARYKNKIDPRALMHLPSVRAMEEAAQAATQPSLVEENARLKAELAQARLTPATSYSSGVGSMQSGSASYIESLKTGKPLPSAVEIDREVAAWLRRQAT